MQLSCINTFQLFIGIIFTNVVFSQNFENEYYELKKSKLEYSCKNEQINLLFESDFYKKNTLDISYLYNDFGKFNYKNGDVENAIINTSKALRIQKEYADSVPSAINKSYNNIALFHLFSGNEPMASQTFNELIKQPYIDKYSIDAYTIRLTDLCINRGDYFKAIQYLQDIENRIYKSDNPKHRQELYRVYLSFSRVYAKMGTRENDLKAINYLKKTEGLIDHLPKTLYLKTTLIIQARYGWIYDGLENYEEAILHYKKALEIGLKHFPNKNKDIATSYDALGHIHAKMHLFELAYQFYDKALQYDPFKTSTYDNLGDYYLYKKDFIKALEHYQKAIAYNTDVFSNIDYNSSTTLEALTQATKKTELVNDLKDKANAWFQYYEHTKNNTFLEQALSTIILADKLIDMIRSENIEQQSKYFWRSKGVDLYILATSICYELNDAKRAFFFMEKSKSLSLLEDITHEEAKNQAHLPNQIKEQEYKLKYIIYKERNRLLKDSTLNKLEKEAIIFEHKNNYERFINSLEKEYPGYYAYKKNISITSLKDCQSKIINSNTGNIQYILTENEGYGIFITSDNTHFFKINDVEKLNERILEITALIKKPFYSKQAFERYTELAFVIYEQLFPFYKTTNSIPINHLVIVPDFTLNYFPFETLITSSPKDKNDLKYLIKSTEIAYAYSISILDKIASIYRKPSSKIIGFAPIHFTNKLPSLTRSKKKMNCLKEIWDSTILEEKDASKRNFIDKVKDYEIIHLSTHAGAITNKEPWIAFNDSVLRLNELYFVKNQADLVFLDACKTGTGHLQSGEGLMSLSRGFFHAGAKSVISSLWNTNEKSSSKIVYDFYSFLKDGNSKSSALRKAKLKYINEHQLSEKSPHFWAPLIFNGTIEASNLNKDYSNYYYLGILITVVIIILIIGYKKFT